MFGQTEGTAYDLRFTLWNIPVRVHPVFWLTATYLSWFPERLDLTFVGVICVFIAIFVHEMGHALANKFFGWQSEIVLYFFGGYATTTRHSYGKNIIVCAAGPLAGFLLWGICETVLFLNHEGKIQLSLMAFYACMFSAGINLLWSIMNLMPVFPLDGGQIARNGLMWFVPRQGALYAINLSILTAGAIALWAFHCRQNNQSALGLDPTFLLIMFGLLCFQSVQMRKMITHGGYYR